MADSATAFVGNIPANYDRHLDPLLFRSHADDLVARLPVTPGMRVLETACGTGIVTRRLADRVGPASRVVATDLNEAMIAEARARLAGVTTVEWRQADATNLPFPDRSFDAVVCQFGLMFYPDKAAGLSQALRVLVDGGLHLFNVWDAIEHNDAARITHETVARFFPDDPPRFYTVPFSLHDHEALRSLLAGVGFEHIRHESVAATGTSPSAEEAAIGLIEGNPIVGEIMSRRPEALRDIEAAVAQEIARRLGDRPVRGGLRAHVFSATRPVRS